MTRPTQRPDRLWRREQEKKEPVRDWWPALTGDVNGVVQVPHRPFFIYVRVGSDKIPDVAYNNCVPNRENLPVVVGYSPWQDEVLQVLEERVVYQGTNIDDDWVLPRVPWHHESHEWGNPLGGDDAPLFHLRQLNEQMFRVGKDPSGNFVVKITGGIIRIGSHYDTLAEQTLDLAGYVPPGILGRYILVYLDDAGVAHALAGTSVPAAGLTMEDSPTGGIGDRALAAVRLYAWQTEIDDYLDIEDLRWSQIMDTINFATTQMLLRLEHEFDLELTRWIVEGSSAKITRYLSQLEHELDFDISRHVVEG